MSISSVFFIFIFLPVCLAAYYILPGILKNVFLLLASIVFYAWGNPAYLIVLTVSIVFNYFTALEMESHLATDEQQQAKRALVIGIIFNVAVLGFFKYYGFCMENVNAILPVDFPIQKLPLPIGISFFTFSVLSYLADVYRKKVPVQHDFIAFGVYVAFFAKVTSGPIVRYEDMAAQLVPHKFNRGETGAGVAMFIRGLGKKVLIADNFGTMHAAITALTAGQMTVLTAWFGCIAYTLQIYFDFSGYSDMAIGLGKMFGFKITKNFDYPYISKSVTEFWRRWHMTLGTWFREYIYIPLGGNRAGTAKHIRNIMIVWLLTGVWHGAAWNFIFWGLYYGVLQLFEKYFFQKQVLDRLPKVFSHIYTMLCVMIGWTIFAAPSMGSALAAIGQMFGMGVAGFANGITWYYIKTNLIQLVFAVICSTPVVYGLYKRFAFKKSRGRIYISCAIYLGIFLCTLAYLINATYQSFLYVQF